MAIIKDITEGRHQHCRLLEVKPLTMIFPLHHMIAGDIDDHAMIPKSNPNDNDNGNDTVDDNNDDS